MTSHVLWSVVPWIVDDFFSVAGLSGCRSGPVMARPVFRWGFPPFAHAPRIADTPSPGLFSWAPSAGFEPASTRGRKEENPIKGLRPVRSTTDSYEGLPVHSDVEWADMREGSNRFPV